MCYLVNLVVAVVIGSSDTPVTLAVEDCNGKPRLSIADTHEEVSLNEVIVDKNGNKLYIVRIKDGKY